MAFVNEDEQHHLLGEECSDLDVSHGKGSASTAEAAPEAASAAAAFNWKWVTVGLITIIAVAALVIQWTSDLGPTPPSVPNFLGLAATNLTHVNATNATNATMCAAARTENCNEVKCCKDAGFECFEKNEWWAACDENCTPGINPRDEYPHNTSWSCKKLTEGGKPNADECSESHENCMESRCCRDEGYKCYRKNNFWANCNDTCSPGPHAWDSDQLAWDCSEVAEEPLCSNDDENCLETGCCSREGYTCFRKNDYWAKCTFECTPGERNILDPEEHREPWNCDIIEMPCNESATPAELLACCKSFACEDFADVELCALDKCGFYAAALSNTTAAPVAVKSATAVPTALGSRTTMQQTPY